MIRKPRRVTWSTRSMSTRYRNPSGSSMVAGAVMVAPKAVDDRDVHVKDYDVALSVRLRSLSDLEGYATHPQHRELVEKWKGRATWRVVDFYDR